MPRFPSSVEELGPELLTQVLSERQPGVRVEGVTVIDIARRGDGLASTADRVILGLDFAEGTDCGLPERVLLKTTLDRSHIPDVMYQNEVRFYRELRPEIEIEAPAVFASIFDPDTTQFGVVMEDLTLRDARFPNATTPVSIEAVRSIVEALARLHASYWRSPRFSTDLAWLATPCSGGMFPVFKNLGHELISDQLRRHEFKRELIAPLGRSFDQLWEDLWKLQSILDSDPCTLLHGDPHIANTYLLPGDQGGLLDWQLTVRGRWSHDLTYLLITGLSTELRREHERELIGLYLDRLAAAGVSEPPSADEAWQLYRQSVVWGLVIGWLITPPENYGEPITRANIERLVTAAQDLETFAALP